MEDVRVMSEATEILDHLTIEKVSRLRLVARTVVESFIQGQHRSVYKGFSVEFAQHREYARGDEMRHIDWKVFGRSDRLFVKQYEEETNLRAMICLDASGSMAFTSNGESKFGYAQRAAAALAYLMVAQSDSVGLTTFDTEIRASVPPRSTKGHLTTLLKVLAETQPGKETSLAKILHTLTAQIKRRGLVIIVSDFFAKIDELVPALAHLRHKRHEVILIQVLDPQEETFPFQQMYEFRSMENPEHRIKLDAPRVRAMYLDRFESHKRQLQEACHQFHFDYVTLTTDKPLDAALSHYLRHRQEQ
jgi:uncharacterized protein (DUF58 family)